MNEIAKSIRVGTINFFGIVVPGLLMIFIIYIGCVMPITSTIALLTYEDPGNQEKTVTTEKQYDASNALEKTVEIETTVSDFESQTGLKKLSTGYQFLDLVVLLVVSYVLGYILRLSSPDELDRISATKVLDEEKKYQEWKIISEYRKVVLKYAEDVDKEKIPEERELYKILTRSFSVWNILRKIRKIWPFNRDNGVFFKLSEGHELSENYVKEQIGKFKDDDKWPFDPYNYFDKFPYFGFKAYLEQRKHDEKLVDCVDWGDNFKKIEIPDDVKAKMDASSEKNKETTEDSQQGETTNKRRSKTHINQMKMNIRVYCPELIDSLESKEAHIRLMAGTWAAFKFSLRFVVSTGLLLIVVLFAPLLIVAPQLEVPNNNGALIFFLVICVLLSIGMILSRQRIEKLFHYRRVSELFHIVQAAALAQEVKGNKENSGEPSKGKPTAP